MPGHVVGLGLVLLARRVVSQRLIEPASGGRPVVGVWERRPRGGIHRFAGKTRVPHRALLLFFAPSHGVVLPRRCVPRGAVPGAF